MRQRDIKENLLLRSRVIHAIRSFFIEHDYLEVETPIRIPAPAPERHIDAVPSESWFLHTSPELCMKRLLAAGYPRIFQICRCFRHKERGRKHLPEFSLAEWYHAGFGYTDLMNECEDLILFCGKASGFGDILSCQGEDIHLEKPWTRLSVEEAFDEFASVSMETALSQGRFDEVMAEIEPRLGHGKPLFLYDYPAASGALARLRPDKPWLAERFELYISGLELCNAFTELTDPEEQRLRFEQEIHDRKMSGKQTYPMPENFLNALQFMPPASGNALGADRLVMLFCNTRNIDDVVAFVPEEL